MKLTLIEFHLGFKIISGLIELIFKAIENKTWVESSVKITYGPRFGLISIS